MGGRFDAWLKNKTRQRMIRAIRRAIVQRTIVRRDCRDTVGRQNQLPGHHGQEPLRAVFGGGMDKEKQTLGTKLKSGGHALLVADGIMGLFQRAIRRSHSGNCQSQQNHQT